MGEVQRRRSQRHPTGCPAAYRFSRADPWRNSRIVDVSEHGATISLDELAPGESFGDRIELEVSSAPPDPVGVVLRAQIRHRSRRPDGLVIGVEFLPTSTDRVNLLRFLTELHAAADA